MPGPTFGGLSSFEEEEEEQLTPQAPVFEGVSELPGTRTQFQGLSDFGNLQYPISVPDRPSVSTQLEEIKAHPSFYENLDRAGAVFTVGEALKTGAQEIGAIGETVLKMGLNIVGQGFAGAEAGARTVVGEVKELFGYDDDVAFYDRYVTEHTKLAAAAGRVFDYDPIIEQTQRNVDAVQHFFDATVGRFGTYLGDETLEFAELHNAKGGPELAAAMKVAPDAALLLLPLGMARGRRVAALERRTKIKEFEEQLAAAADNIQSGDTPLMPVSVLDRLEGAKPKMDLAELSQLADDVRTGRASGEIIVETVEGTPTRILSGAEKLAGAKHAAAKYNMQLNNLRVKVQERTVVSEAEAAQLRTAGREGLQAVRDNLDALKLLERGRTRTIGQALNRLLVDTSANVKAALLKKGGEAGKAAVQDFSLKAGATPYAHLRYQQTYRSIYEKRGFDDPGISRKQSVEVHGQRYSERELVDILAQSRRTQAIVKSGGTKGGKLAGAVKPEHAAGNIFSIREVLGEKRFAQLNSRVDTGFQVMLEQLVRMRENGLITAKQFNKMKDIDYVKRDFIDQLDPIVNSQVVDGKLLSVGDSGIYRLGRGSGRPQNLEFDTLLAEVLARSEGRIARNKANQSLLRVAEEVPDNGFVEIGRKKPRPGFTEIKVMVDGKPQSIHMKDVFAHEWTIGDPGMNAMLSNFFKIVNGTFIVKPLATGINPGFALVNFPRDILHAWKPTGPNTYSAFLPIYLGQIFRDIGAVSRDAWRKTGRYQEFIEEGGGMNFLSHEGFNIFTGLDRTKDAVRAVQTGRGRFGKAYSELKETLAKLNEFSELSVRLAIRERVLKNQRKNNLPVDKREATFIARDYLDFSQGGSLTKAMESFIPYTNAAAQAIRTSFREYKRGVRNASYAAVKDLQVVSLKAMHSAWAWSVAPGVMAQVDPHTQINNMIFPTGMSYTDDRGNRRHVVVKIAMDPTVTAFTAPYDAAVRKRAMVDTGLNPDEVPSSHLLQQIASTLPIIGNVGVGSPTTQAIVALASNLDLWNNTQIWRGDPLVDPGFRRTTDTGEIFKALGDIAPEVVSPVQLEKAVRTYVPSNTYIHSADWVDGIIRRAADPEQAEKQYKQTQDDITKEILSEFPLLNRLLHVTHPAAQTRPEMQTRLREIRNWRELNRQEVDRAVRQTLATGSTERLQTLLQAVAQIRPQDVETIQEQFLIDVVVEKAFEQNEYDIGFVGEDWFHSLAGLPPEDKAELVYSKWVELTDDNARNLMAVIEQIDKVGGSRIRTPDFEKHFRKLIATQGHRSERKQVVMDGR